MLNAETIQPITDAPRASGFDYSGSRNNDRRVGLFALATLAAASFAGAEIVSAQENPARTTIDPNCNNPSSLESEMPSSSPFLENPDGSLDVFVSPSPFPSPLTSSETTGVIAQTDGSILTPECPIPLLTGVELINKSVNQPVGEIRSDVTISNLHSFIDSLWKEHGEEMATNNIYGPTPPLKKSDLNRQLSIIEKGTPEQRKIHSKKGIELDRADGAEIFMIELAYMVDHGTPELKADIEAGLNLGDDKNVDNVDGVALFFDYGANISGKNNQKRAVDIIMQNLPMDVDSILTQTEQ